MTTHSKTLTLILGVVFGIVIGETSIFSTEVAVTFTLIFLVLLLVFYISKRRGESSLVALATAIISLGIVIGIIRTQLVVEKNIVTCPSSCQIEGVVIRKEETKDTNQIFDVSVEEGYMNVRVRAPLYPDYFVGDKVTLLGKVSEPKKIFPHAGGQSFDYASYLHIHDVGSEMYYPKVISRTESALSVQHQLQKFHENLVSRSGLYVSEPASSLASGMLLGVTNFSSELAQSFRVAGLSHIIVLSGFNITILITFVLFLFKPLPLTFRIVGATLLVVTFVAMVGGGSSLLRATIMALVALVALFFGRGYVASQALLLSFLIIILYSPLSLLYDVSLHLSFLATCGIVYGYENIKERLAKLLPPILLETASATLAAYVMTLPYILYTFGTFSLYAVFANLLVLPLVPITMSFTAVTLLLSFVNSSLAFSFGFLVTMFADTIIFLARLIEKLPFAKVDTSISFFSMLALYAIIGCMFLFLRTEDKNETTETKDGELVSPLMRF